MADFEDFTALGTALPGAAEQITWDQVTLRVGRRMFALGAPGADSVSVKASREEQQELIAMDGATFSVAPYVGRFGWVRVRLAGMDRRELRELLTEAWRRTAPRALVREVDATTATGPPDRAR